MKLIPTSLLSFALVSCLPNSASVDEGWSAERLPTSEEVIIYVRDHWEADYGKRYAQFSSRPNDNAELIEIGDVACDYYIVTPQCSGNYILDKAPLKAHCFLTGENDGYHRTPFHQ